MLFLILLIAIIIIVVIAAKDNPNKDIFIKPDESIDDNVNDITIEFRKSSDGSEKAQKIYNTDRFSNVSIDIYKGAKYCDDEELFFIELWHHETKNNLTFSDVTKNELLLLLKFINKL